jgi:hypothetical protein
MFDPIKVPFFSVILVYSGSFRHDLQESYPMFHGTSYTDILAPYKPPTGTHWSDPKNNVSFVISMVNSPKTHTRYDPVKFELLAR